MKKALLILCLFASVAIGQSSNLTGIPDDATIFVITLREGKELRGESVVYGALKIRGEFITGKYPEQDSDIPTNINIVFDSPSDPGEVTVLKSNLHGAPQPEVAQLRPDRYKREGFDFTTGSDGKTLLVAQHTLQKVERLRELQQAVEASNTIPEYDDVEATTSASTTGPGFFALWGRQLLTLMVAGLVLFGITKTCF
tara:strand:+ start:269 stop:862 length:594 start_codon:yes stop_codon:yes gene_type:complete